MNDVMIFIVGCVVTLAVMAAVGVLFWGAAQEP